MGRRNNSGEEKKKKKEYKTLRRALEGCTMGRRGRNSSTLSLVSGVHCVEWARREVNALANPLVCSGGKKRMQPDLHSSSRPSSTDCCCAAEKDDYSVFSRRDRVTLFIRSRRRQQDKKVHFYSVFFCLAQVCCLSQADWARHSAIRQQNVGSLAAYTFPREIESATKSQK